jgi:hypothetical protein
MWSNLGIIPVFAWRTDEKPQKKPVRIASLWAKI